MENQFVTLDEIVNAYLSQYRLPDSDYHRISVLGIRAMKDMHLTSTGTLVRAKLTVLANKTAKLPVGLLNISRLFVSLGDPAVTDYDVDLHESDDLFIENSYSYDRANEIIRFPAGFAHNTVYLDFLPLAHTDGDYVAHPMFVQAVIDWIIWQDGRGDRRSSDSRNRENRTEFYNSLRIARNAANPFNLNQVYLNYSRVISNTLRAYRWR